MNQIKACLALCILLFIASCSHDVTIQNLSKVQLYSNIVRLDTNKSLSFTELLNELDSIDVLLVGELHYDKNHRLAQISLINELSKRKKLDVAMEMISSEKQNLIDKAYQDNVHINEILGAINWDKNWRISHYGEIVKTAYEKANLKAANLSKSEIDTIFSGAEPIKGVVSTTQSVKEMIATAIGLAHVADEKMRNKLVQAQLYKDRRMADVLNKTQNFSLLIAGVFHTHKDVGVPLHLIDFNTQKRVKVLILGSSDYRLDDVNIYKADYFWQFR
ncbi:ChaN family lipoprotein [Campylobacter majalis]|uniref:ChaN family lipoprotein n=1 Tax=Campylobacter majalis TaxID=2790656 RepID=UPI003D69C074